MTPEEYREIAKALRRGAENCGLSPLEHRADAKTLWELANVADHMAEWTTLQSRKDLAALKDS